MPACVELDLAGAAKRVELADVGEVAPVLGPADFSEAADLPEGFGTATPVASGGRAAALAQDVLSLSSSAC
ncbi:hypothetical protein OG361_34305 [Streptomyces sp. NBC_00090]|uniref:hypothetical protein n=1 Tax=Streptomyces sp. NBC_00090 TaxID=2903619 RepID=UPI00324424DE